MKKNNTLGQSEFIPEMQDQFNIQLTKNITNKKIIISIDMKTFDKIQDPFIITLSKLAIGRHFFNLIKDTYNKPIISITLSGERKNVFN